MPILKTPVHTTDEKNNPLELAVLAPSGKAKNDARIYQMAQYHDAARRGVMIRPQLEKYLRTMNLWDDDRQKEAERLSKAIVDGERALTTKKSKEGKPLRLSEGRNIALQMITDRAALVDLRTATLQVEANTAEMLSEQAYFNYLASVCTVYNSGGREGEPYFVSVDDYVERGATKVANDAATALSDMIYGRRSDQAAELPENKFLVKYNFMDKELRLIDKQGRLVDRNGKLIDREGYYVDEAGNRIDIDGHPVDSDGNFKADPDACFLDDDGNPILEDAPAAATEASPTTD